MEEIFDFKWDKSRLIIWNTVWMLDFNAVGAEAADAFKCGCGVDRCVSACFLSRLVIVSKNIFIY